MTTKRIDELDAATAVTGDDLFVIMDGATTTKKVTATNALTFFEAAGAAAAAQAASQPLDSDLTAIAALSTTTFGRALLALVDAAALRSAAGLGTAATAASSDFQPIDSDLTAIAALSTTSYGRAFLALADAAAARTAMGLGTAATTAATDYATAAQGTKADSAVQPTIVDAKGDLLVGTAADTVARLPVGTNNYVLTADSSQAAGVKWAAAAGMTQPGALDVSALATFSFGVPNVVMWNPNSTRTSEAGRMYGAPMAVFEAITLTAIRGEVTTLVAGSTTCFAIVKATALWEIESTSAVIYQGTVSSASTGVKDLTGLSVAIPAGNYWLLWGASAANVVVRTFQGQPSTGHSLRQDGVMPIPYVSVTAGGTGGLSDPIGTWAGAVSGSGFHYPFIMKWTT